MFIPLRKDRKIQHAWTSSALILGLLSGIYIEHPV